MIRPLVKRTVLCTFVKPYWWGWGILHCALFLDWGARKPLMQLFYFVMFCWLDWLLIKTTKPMLAALCKTINCEHMSTLSPPHVFAPLINLDLLYSNSQNSLMPWCVVWSQFCCLYLKCECLVRREKRREWRRNVCVCVFVCKGALSADTGTDAGTQGNPDTQRSTHSISFTHTYTLSHTILSPSIIFAVSIKSRGYTSNLIKQTFSSIPAK